MLLLFCCCLLQLNLNRVVDTYSMLNLHVCAMCSAHHHQQQQQQKRNTISRTWSTPIRIVYQNIKTIERERERTRAETRHAITCLRIIRSTKAFAFIIIPYAFCLPFFCFVLFCFLFCFLFVFFRAHLAITSLSFQSRYANKTVLALNQFGWKDEK